MLCTAEIEELFESGLFYCICKQGQMDQTSLCFTPSDIEQLQNILKGLLFLGHALHEKDIKLTLDK